MATNRFMRTKASTGIYRRGGKYEVFVYFHGSSYSAGTYETLYAAKRARAGKLHELERRRSAGLLLRDSTVQFRLWVNDWWARKRPHLKPSTVRSTWSIVQHSLLPVLGDCRLCDLTPHAVEVIAQKLAPNQAEKTRRNTLQVLREILQDAVRMGVISANPAQYLQLPKLSPQRVTAVEPETAQRIIRRMTPRYQEAAWLALLTGLRMGELLALQWDDCDLVAGAIHVRRARDASGIVVTPKTAAGVREVPLGPATVAFLRAFQETRANRPCDPSATAYLFPVYERDPRTPAHRLPVMDHRRLQKAFFDAAEAEGVKVRFHDLRHTFASQLLATGGSEALGLLAKCLGHSSLAFSLQRYSHFIPSRARAFLSGVDALAPSTRPSTQGARGRLRVLQGGRSVEK